MLELSGIVILGILSQWIAWRMKIPAILPLIVIGLLVGPISTLYTSDHTKLIEPIWNGSEGIFPQDIFFAFVSLSISVILFEGGLTLKIKEIKNTGKTIGSLVTIGALVTFFLAGIAARFLFDLPWSLSLLFSSLIIVTGPTVIAPILRNIPLRKDPATVLKWESILIDPIGALAALLVYEFITHIGDTQTFTLQAFLDSLKNVLIGVSVGFTFAYAFAFLVRKHWIPHYLLNVVTLGLTLSVFVVSNLLARDSGLISVVVMGMVVGNSRLPNIKELLYFKETLTVLLISILFITLSADINLEDLWLVYNWNTLYLFLVIILVVRPVGVFLSSRKSNLRFGEKLFISWVGPRGIVAAGVASLFGQRLVEEGVSGAEYITPLVFTIVLGTVLLNAATAGIFAKITGVFLSKSEGILVVGGTTLSLMIAKYLQDKDRQVVVIDNNLDHIHKAETEGLKALHANVFSDELNLEDLNSMGYLLALTPNYNVNEYTIHKYKDLFGENGSFRWMTPDEQEKKETTHASQLISRYGDYDFFNALMRDFPTISEYRVSKSMILQEALSVFSDHPQSIPFFVVTPEDKIEPLTNVSDEFLVEKGSLISYIGRPLM